MKGLICEMSKQIRKRDGMEVQVQDAVQDAVQDVSKFETQNVRRKVRMFETMKGEDLKPRHKDLKWYNETHMKQNETLFKQNEMPTKHRLSVKEISSPKSGWGGIKGPDGYAYE